MISAEVQLCLIEAENRDGCFEHLNVDSNNWQPTEGILKTPLPYWSFKLVPFPWMQVCHRWWSSAGWAHGLKGEFLICSWFGHVQVSKMMWDLCKKLVTGLDPGVLQAFEILQGLLLVCPLLFECPGDEAMQGVTACTRMPCVGLKAWDFLGICEAAFPGHRRWQLWLFSLLVLLPKWQSSWWWALAA